MRSRQRFRIGPLLTIFVCTAILGCHGSLVPDAYPPDWNGQETEFLVIPEEVGLSLPNPSAFSPTNSEAFWNELVDIVSDYFRIQQEQRVQVAIGSRGGSKPTRRPVPPTWSPGGGIRSPRMSGRSPRCNRFAARQ